MLSLTSCLIYTVSTRTSGVCRETAILEKRRNQWQPAKRHGPGTISCSLPHALLQFAVTCFPVMADVNSTDSIDIP
ncbi:hypothetical protein AAHA92_15414 [Salvia divinorum]|uniref:Uncharacterized protein n=1 Tax=Salvia divinorum TaxID=28513 RepID=A0ABD1HEM5_SALDI